MPVMNIDTWNIATRKDTYNALTPRPALLAAIDLALAAYHEARSSTTLQGLRTAVDACAANPPIVTGLRAYGSAVTDLKQSVDAESGITTALIKERSEAGEAADRAADALTLTSSTADSVAVKASITQCCNGVGASWTVYWNLKLSAPVAFTKPSGTLGVLTVSVPVVLNPRADETIAAVERMKTLWKTHITTMWNGAKFKVKNDRMLEVVFDIEWCANTTIDAFRLDAAPTLPMTPPADWRAAAEAAANNKAWGFAPEQIGNNVGTPHLEQWGEKDVCAVSHEFGHMLGLPDEYLTTTYMNEAVPDAVYDQRPFTTESLMNNTSENGRLHKRHYHLIRRSLEKWKCLPQDTTLTILKGSPN